MPNIFSSDPLIERLCGAYTDPDFVQQSRQEWLKSQGALGDFQLVQGLPGPRPKRVMLWELTRKVLNGKDTPNYPQLIGDCTSFAGKNVTEYRQLLLMLLGNLIDFKSVFPSYYYGNARVLVGGQRGSRQDGATAAWIAQAAMKYGFLSTDAQNCPKYSADIAKEWGRTGVPQDFVNIGKTHLIKTTALVSTEDQAKDALASFYPVSIASNYGYDMKQRSDGLFYNSTKWSHNMTLLGYDEGEPDGSIIPHACILNNWGDVHGKIIDFRTKEPWPIGTLRVPLKDVAGITGAGDSYSYSEGDFFKAPDLSPDFFQPWSVA